MEVKDIVCPPWIIWKSENLLKWSQMNQDTLDQQVIECSLSSPSFYKYVLVDGRNEKISKL